MIIRERPNEFVMIEQDNHAFVSGEIMKHWKDELFLGKERRKSVEDAIYYHDYGWRLFDQQPFWNDKKGEPYSFSDFPLMPKTVLYQHGIDAVEKIDDYAALLCSHHYVRFLDSMNTKEAKQFVDHEIRRQHRLIESMKTFDQQLFDFHFGLLLFGDSISLYLCLNEPGIAEGQEHPFFRDGISVSEDLIGFKSSNTAIRWKDKENVTMDEFPFKHPFTIQLKQKRVSKQDIAVSGLIESYENTAFEEVEIYLTNGD